MMKWGALGFCRWGMWVRNLSGREASEGEGECSEPSAVQEGARVWGMLQGEVRGQEHLLATRRHGNCDGRVPRRPLREWEHPLRPQWRGVWAHGYSRWGWPAQEPRPTPSRLPAVRMSFFATFRVYAVAVLCRRLLPLLLALTSLFGACVLSLFAHLFVN